MIERLVRFALAPRLMVCLAGLALLFDGLYAFHILDVVAYPDPSPPMNRLARRVDEQFARGVVDEVRGLLAAGVPRTAHAFTGLVYRQVLEHLEVRATRRPRARSSCARTGATRDAS